MSFYTISLCFTKGNYQVFHVKEQNISIFHKIIVIRSDNNHNLCIRIDQKSCSEGVIEADMQWQMCDMLYACDTADCSALQLLWPGLFQLLRHYLITDIRRVFLEWWLTFKGLKRF